MKWLVEFRLNTEDWKKVERPFLSRLSAELFCILAPAETRIVEV